MSYLLEDRLDAALPYLEAAHAAQPDEPAFLNNLAILYMKKGNLDTALRYAEESAKLAPHIRFAHIWLCRRHLPPFFASRYRASAPRHHLATGENRDKRVA